LEEEGPAPFADEFENLKTHVECLERHIHSINEFLRVAHPTLLGGHFTTSSWQQAEAAKRARDHNRAMDIATLEREGYIVTKKDQT
jgi:hypothetical protein